MIIELLMRKNFSSPVVIIEKKTNIFKSKKNHDGEMNSEYFSWLIFLNFSCDIKWFAIDEFKKKNNARKKELIAGIIFITLSIKFSFIKLFSGFCSARRFLEKVSKKSLSSVCSSL